MKQLIAFDLDGTLAESKQPLHDEMGAALATLLDMTEVAVISGGDWPQFEMQVMSRMPNHANLARLWIMPTTGFKLYRYQDRDWHEVYADRFDQKESDTIVAAIQRSIAEANFGVEKSWGEKIEDRGTQITFSALGQEAPLDAKKARDPDRGKRKTLQTILRKALPALSVKVGGSTSIDITQKGVDKGSGLIRLAQHSGSSLADMLFLGDAIYPGGNDYPAREAGVDSVAVRDVAETRTVIAAITTWIGKAA